MMMLLVNRDQLAQHLRCSLPTVDAMIKRWPDFPVMERGGLGKPWKFNAIEVVDYLQAKRDEEDRLKQERSELLAQLTLPLVRTDANGQQIDLDDQLKAIKLRKAQREEAIESGVLVPTLEVRIALERALRRYSQAQDSAIERVVKNHNLPEAVKRALVIEFNDCRTAFVREAAKYLNNPAADDEQFQLYA